MVSLHEGRNEVVQKHGDHVLDTNELTHLFFAIATEAEIANATANRNLAQEVELAGQETSPVEGGRRGMIVNKVYYHKCEIC